MLCFAVLIHLPAAFRALGPWETKNIDFDVFGVPRLWKGFV